MCDSPRPDQPMTPVCPGRRSTADTFAPLALRAWRSALLPLAMAALTTSAFAAGHHAPLPLPRHAAASHAAPVRKSRAEVAEPVARGGRGHAKAGSLAPTSSGKMGRHARAVELPERPGARRLGRAAAETEPVVAYDRHGRPLAARNARGLRQATASTHQLVASHTATREADDAAADRQTTDRVHAWYSHHATATEIAAAEPAKLTRHPAAAATSVAPDLSPVAHKATVADFDRAAAAQRRTIQSTAEQNQRQTTAADDTADAESHIPSTAPTEREPAPFVHGDADGSAAAPSHSRLQVAPRTPGTTPVTTPASASIAAAPAQQAIGIAPPARVDLPRRADMRQPSANRSASATDAALLARSPIAIASAADSSSRAVRALAAEAVTTPTPRVVLPAPPSAALAKTAPAAAAVQLSARKPQLDPAVAEGMAEENFDDDGTPATARTAVALASGGLVPAKVKPATQDDAEPLTASAAVPVNLYDGQGHLVLVAPMKGSHEILVHQNQMAVSDGLERIEDDTQLAEMRRLKLLVALPDDDSIYPNDALPLNRRFARPWTVRFLRDIARAHYARFGTPLIVTSAVRTVEFQRHLVRINGNAAPPTGDIASPHLYGQAIDIAKRGMNLTEIMWMRAYLTPVEADGKIDVEEEFQQACFHMSVYRRYLGNAAPKVMPKQTVQPTLLEAKSTPETQTPAVAARKRRLPTALLATGLR